nr:hypothetical protein BaRGS_019216 [Batillaria attramentaria]
MFVKKKAQSVEGKSKDRFSELGRQWASLSDKKRQKYQKKFEKCKQQYLEEVENFKQTLSEDDLALYLKSLQPKKRRKVDTGNGAIN